MKLSDYVVGFVADLGVKHVFVVTGGGAMHLNDSLARCERLEFICNHHEQACAIAADNYSKPPTGLASPWSRPVLAEPTPSPDWPQRSLIPRPASFCLGK